MAQDLNDPQPMIPKGFRFGGSYCGIKTASESRDISLVYSEVPAIAAGVYTQNHVVAAPVLNCREKTPTATIQAVITNSGNANACTGARGMDDAQRMCELAAKECSSTANAAINADNVLVMSTGIIGHHLPMDKIEKGIADAASQLEPTWDGFLASADGILTTDVARKIATRTLSLNGQEVTIAGMAKGAGMIGPNMATMLCTLCTDAELTPEQAQALLSRVADKSFNNISVEGHTSTNDTMLLLANGEYGGGPLAAADLELLFEAICDLSIELAKQIPADGEGASHLMEVRIRGAADDAQARQIANAVCSSNLVKTAIYGNDPNWGRIVSAAGYAGPEINPHEMVLRLNGIILYQQGEPVAFDEAAASQSMKDSSTVEIDLEVGTGSGSSTHWTSDLTVEYVRFNSEYTT